MTPASSHPSVQDTTQDLRTRVLDAAAPLFADRGYAATSMREVALAVGCTKPALYYWFPSKEALFLAVVERYGRAMDAILEEGLSHPGTLRERLVATVRRWFGFVTEHPVAVRLLVRLHTRPEEGAPVFDCQPMQARTSQLMRRILEGAGEGGELRADVDVDDALLALMGMVDLRVLLWLTGVPFPDDLPERLVGILLRGVAR